MSDNAVKLLKPTIIPDKIPPLAPANATKTSTAPCVFARVSIVVESTSIAVPLFKPKFQPNQYKTHDLSFYDTQPSLRPPYLTTV